MEGEKGHTDKDLQEMASDGTCLTCMLLRRQVTLEDFRIPVESLYLIIYYFFDYIKYTIIYNYFLFYNTMN